jgi:hypothetical protein
MLTAELPENITAKLQILQEKLGADDLDSALDKSLDIANYIADKISDPESKLLIERHGKYTELKGIA